MGAGTIVFSALKAVGKWVAHNPAIVIDAADKAINLKPNDKVNQLGNAVLELDHKINNELNAVKKQLRTIEIILSVMAALLLFAIITIIWLII